MAGILRTVIAAVPLALLVSCGLWGLSPVARSAPEASAKTDIEVRTFSDETGGTVARGTREAVMRILAARLREANLPSERSALILDASVLSCANSNAASTVPSAGCVISVTVTEKTSGQIVTKVIVPTLALQGPASPSNANVDSAAGAILQEVAADVSPTPNNAIGAGEEITAQGAHVTYRGDGVFLVDQPGQGASATVIDLKRIRHAYNRAVDKDVPEYTNVTLNDVVPRLIDSNGHEYARITLYQIDPPLVSQPSKEPGINRGTDFRDPSNLLKGAYSNYVSPVLTNDREQRRVPSHPIGHFYVKVEIPGYPTVLTGMTTIARADTELADLTIGRELGIGGVLLTPEPGRLNSATEALEELTLRQRELRVVDGLYFNSFLGRNSGPEYIVDNGNAVFAQFKVPVKNAKDAMAFFVEFLARGEQNTFGSLLNRPERGTGSGCTPFAISWLEAAGVIPFIGDPADSVPSQDTAAAGFGPDNFWIYVHRTIYIPWSQIGCDERLGVDRIVPAQYTIYDLLFHNLSSAFVREASEGLAAKIKRDYGFVAGTLFQFGALSPLRDLIVSSKRKDPQDRGDYNWGKPGAGLEAPFWDNARFSAWVKSFRDHPRDQNIITSARAGRLYGIAFDAMNAKRQTQPFFAEADEIAAKKRQFAQTANKPHSCEALLALGIQ